jgi:cell division protein FtsA
MGKVQENILTVFDVGSAKTSVLVLDVTEHGFQYRGHGVRESRGTRKGQIVDLDKATTAIQKAVEDAEQIAQVPIERGVIGVAGPHIRGFNSQGGISLGQRAREVTRDDVRAAVERARSIPLPADRQVLHLLPQDYILDEHSGINDPAGMMAHQLEVRVHVVTAAQSSTQNVVNALNRAGILVDDVVYEPLACADAVLRSDEREIGVVLADIGAGSTDVIVYYEGAVVHTAVIPVGGDHFTNDIAIGLPTPLSEAEKIKKQFGCAVVTRIPEPNEVEVTTVGDRPSRFIQQRFLGEILQPRAQELFEMLRDNLRQAGVLELCGAGIVMTGGGSRMPALMEVAEDILRRPGRGSLPARLGYPAPIANLPSELAELEFATTIGLAYYAHRTRLQRNQQEVGLASRLKSLFARREF